MNGRAAVCVERGQALVETLVAMLLLVPVWWFIQHWQEGQLQRVALVQQARQGALRAVLEAQAPSAVPARTGVTSSLDEVPGPAGVLLRSSRTLIEPVLAISPGDARLDTRGWLQLTVHGEPPVGRFWQQHAGTWRESVTAFVGDWSLARSRQVEARTQALLPTTPLEWAIASLEPLRSAITLLEPAYRSTCARRVDPDVLPVDRVVAGTAGMTAAVSSDGWRPRC
jgi:HAMP domain-containing protein